MVPATIVSLSEYVAKGPPDLPGQALMGSYEPRQRVEGPLSPSVQSVRDKNVWIRQDASPGNRIAPMEVFEIVH